MKKIILVVEDLVEEQEKAKEILLVNDCRPIIAGTLDGAKRIMDNLKGKISGIITDLHFPEKDWDNPKNNPNAVCGLAVIALAIEQNIPVAVCSDIDHHFCDYVKIVIAALNRLNSYKGIPFVMDSKDWRRAFEQLNKLIKAKEE